MKLSLYNVLTGFSRSYFHGLHVPHFCELVLPNDHKRYFKCNMPSALPSSMSQSTTDSVNIELVAVSSVNQSDGSESHGEYIKVSAKSEPS